MHECRHGRFPALRPNRVSWAHSVWRLISCTAPAPAADDTLGGQQPMRPCAEWSTGRSYTRRRRRGSCHSTPHGQAHDNTHPALALRSVQHPLHRDSVAELAYWFRSSPRGLHPKQSIAAHAHPHSRIPRTAPLFAAADLPNQKTRVLREILSGLSPYNWSPRLTLDTSSARSHRAPCRRHCTGSPVSGRAHRPGRRRPWRGRSAPPPSRLVSTAAAAHATLCRLCYTATPARPPPL